MSKDVTGNYWYTKHEQWIYHWNNCLTSTAIYCDSITETAVAEQWLGKHVSTVSNNNATAEELLAAMLSMRYMLRLYKENQMELVASSRGLAPRWSD
jgi:hypothetical protein